ncbi:hypothetical protein V6N12_015693 [Hibiscus sabdariffa]|uniref:Uncharacterized protein n=1 Tax=Hibiscus sabdariffa TaxID=183260 RepID=A0ABR2DP00_9ROSI
MGNLGIREKGGIGQGFSIEGEVEGGDGLRIWKERGFEAVANSNVENGGGSAFCDFQSLVLTCIRTRT